MHIRLTTEIVQGFRGGQAQIIKLEENILYRGEIGDISVDEDNNLHIRFAWLAMGRGHVSVSGAWVNSDELCYKLSLVAAHARNVGPSSGDIGGGDRICIEGIEDLVMLFPSDGSKLDPDVVAGLQLAKV